MDRDSKKEYVKLWLSYESYFEPYSDAEVGRLVRAMMKYRESREEPEFSGNERYVWPAIRRDIDESILAQESAATASRENGKKGGRPKNQKNQLGFEETQKSYGQGQGQGQGQGHGNNPPNPLATVMSAYMDRINPQPSEICIGELKGFAEQMGAECCLRAIQIAQDNRVTRWNYVKQILQSKRAQGVTCLADWDRLEERRKQNGVNENPNSAPSNGGNGAKWNVKSALDDCD